jgi:phosphate uptake regulator
MDIRGIQKTGGQSFVLTLPKQWITTNRMKDKDRVKIVSHRSHLTIIPYNPEPIERNVTCKIDGLGSSQIWREVIGFYISGAENIIVKAEPITLSQRTAVRQISYQLIGCECLEGTTNRIILKSYSPNFQKLMPEYVQRMMATIVSMFVDTLSFLETANRELAQDVIDRDNELDRLHLAIMRFHTLQLNRLEIQEEELSLVDSHFYAITVIRLERIGDHIVKIGKHYLKVEKQQELLFSASEKRILKDLLAELVLCQKTLFNTDKQAAHKYLDSFENFLKLFSKHKYSSTNYFHAVVNESVSRIKSYLANIAEEIINYSNSKLVE